MVFWVRKYDVPGMGNLKNNINYKSCCLLNEAQIQFTMKRIWVTGFVLLKNYYCDLLINALFYCRQKFVWQMVFPYQTKIITISDLKWTLMVMNKTTCLVKKESTSYSVTENCYVYSLCLNIADNGLNYYIVIQYMEIKIISWIYLTILCYRVKSIYFFPTPVLEIHLHSNAGINDCEIIWTARSHVLSRNQRNWY